MCPCAFFEGESITDLLKIVGEFRGNSTFVHFKQLDQYVIGGRNHHVFPEAEVSNIIFENNTVRLHLAHDSLNIVSLDPEMMYARWPSIFRRLVIEVKPPISNFHEYISGTCQLHIEDDLSTKIMLVEVDACLDVRGEYMNMM